MLSRWFARFKMDPDTLRRQKWFALFGERLLTPDLWQSTPRALCGAVAVGLFASWIPVPMHSLVAVALALAFGFNLPLALLAVWFNNPLTLPFMYLYAYRTGCLVLHETPEPFHLIWSLHWLEHEAATLVPPFLLGSLLLAILTATTGALLTLLTLQLGRRIRAS
ncbi:DUF2062 domain-containing protein [Aeromonas sp. FDAARGOS 1409]|uniref:DUF2062 domain-containing protein n=1 Tax=Aeromonas TaxID=642 RepID=UPI001C21DDCD|nr:DUF2062 domain-containing protein [Aeromonas sp. FDAARGOS 1409]QXC29984.1 DUF2062 domain-containing protein [Aeromonas sp. FDAARGOS 1409]